MTEAYLFTERRMFVALGLLLILNCQTFAVLSATPSRILEIDLSLDKEVYSPGDSFIFTIRISNKGDEQIDIYYGKVHVKHSRLAWLGGEFTTEEFDIKLSLEPGEIREESFTRTIQRRIPGWLSIFGDWEFTLILIDGENNEYRSNTLRVKFR